MPKLITHDDRKPNGYDPPHTEKGIKKIQELVEENSGILKTNTVVYGAATRFWQIAQEVLKKNSGAQYKSSFLCGTPEGLDVETNRICLVNGLTVPLKEHEGLEKAVAEGYVNIWRYLGKFPDDTVICAGGELMIALGLNSIRKRGALYEIDISDRSGNLIWE